MVVPVVVAFHETYNSIMIYYNCIALISTSISSITSAITNYIDMESKSQSHNMSNLQFNDLYRDVSARLLRNCMSSGDLDVLLSEINSRISLIEDNSLAIKLQIDLII